MEDNKTQSQEQKEWERLNSYKWIFEKNDNDEKPVKDILDFLENNGAFLYKVWSWDKPLMVYCVDHFKWNKYDLRKYENKDLKLSDDFKEYIKKRLGS